MKFSLITVFLFFIVYLWKNGDYRAYKASLRERYGARTWHYGFFADQKLLKLLNSEDKASLKKRGKIANRLFWLFLLYTSLIFIISGVFFEGKLLYYFVLFSLNSDFPAHFGSDLVPKNTGSVNHKGKYRQLEITVDPIYTYFGMLPDSLLNNLAESSPHSTVAAPRVAATPPHSIVSSPHSAESSPRHAVTPPHSTVFAPRSAESSPHPAVTPPHSTGFAPCSAESSPH